MKIATSFWSVPSRESFPTAMRVPDPVAEEVAADPEHERGEQR